MEALIAPSLLSADFGKLAEESNRMLEYGADWLHVDVMDGHFVNNLTIGSPVVASLRKHTNAFLDCHLMVSEPEKWVEDFKKAGADQYIFHIEATNDVRGLIGKVKESGMKVGISVKPKTAVEEIFPYLEEVDYVLIMTVEPGFGGQSFMEDMMPKVTKLREQAPHMNIGVDGGLGPETIDKASCAGANVIVAGSSIFKSSDPKTTIQILRKSVEENYISKRK